MQISVITGDARSLSRAKTSDIQTTFIGRTVRWLRAPDQTDCIKGARKALALFLAFILTLTIVGFILVDIGFHEWKGQEARDAALKAARLPIEDASPLLPNAAPPEITDTVLAPLPTIPYVVGKADLDLSNFAQYTLSSVSEVEVLAMQDNIVAVNPKYDKLDLQQLILHDLLPKHKMVLGEVNYYFSKIFKFNNHDIVIALVEIDNTVFPCVFYHSNSQGTWRVMPFAGKRPTATDKQIFHFGKGNCETETQLPIPVICALNNLLSPNAFVSLISKLFNSNPLSSPYNPHRLVQSLEFGRLPVFMEKVVSLESMRLAENANEGFFHNVMPNPKSVLMPADENLHPDFSTLVLPKFRHNLPHYGSVSVNIFSSKDKSLLYMFYEANDGRAFLASVECIRGVPINSFGVREKVIRMENMDAPLLEYADQIPLGYSPQKHLYGGFVNRFYETDAYGPYGSNWNYIRELAIIKLYYAAQGRPLPQPVE